MKRILIAFILACAFIILLGRACRADVQQVQGLHFANRPPIQMECDTLGIRMFLAGRTHNILEDYDDAPRLADLSNTAQAFRFLRLRPDLEWLTFVVSHADTTLVWPRGYLPVLYDSEGVETPSVVFVVGGAPQYRMLTPIRLKSGEALENRRGQFVLFAGYPRGKWDPDHVTRVRLEKP